jgi:hypothetical protein
MAVQVAVLLVGTQEQLVAVLELLGKAMLVVLAVAIGTLAVAVELERLAELVMVTIQVRALVAMA